MKKLAHEFGTKELAEEAKRAHEEVKRAHEELQRTMTPTQRKLSDEAEAAMNEVNSVFDGHPVSDVGVNIILSIVDKSGLARDEVSDIIRSMKLGQYISENLSNNIVFFKTPDGKLEEAGTYVNRLEKGLITLMKLKSEEEARETFFYLIKKAFKKLKKGRFK